MFIEVIINLKQVDTRMQEMGLDADTGINHPCPISINLNEITTFRPYIDEEGIPDFEYVHITFKNDDPMLGKFNYNKLKELTNGS